MSREIPLGRGQDIQDELWDSGGITFILQKAGVVLKVSDKR